jgi:hypothetical protein
MSFRTEIANREDSDLPDKYEKKIPDPLGFTALDPFKKVKADMICVLELRHIITSTANWVALGQIPTLRVLYVHDRLDDLPSGLDSTVIRAWGRQAQDDGAFPNLRVLKLQDQPDMTHRWLDEVNRISSLRLCHFSRPDMDITRNDLVPSIWRFSETGSK